MIFRLLFLNTTADLPFCRRRAKDLQPERSEFDSADEIHQHRGHHGRQDPGGKSEADGAGFPLAEKKLQQQGYKSAKEVFLGICDNQRRLTLFKMN